MSFFLSEKIIILLFSIYILFFVSCEDFEKKDKYLPYQSYIELLGEYYELEDTCKYMCVEKPSRYITIMAFESPKSSNDTVRLAFDLLNSLCGRPNSIKDVFLNTELKIYPYDSTHIINMYLGPKKGGVHYLVDANVLIKLIENLTEIQLSGVLNDGDSLKLYFKGEILDYSNGV